MIEMGAYRSPDLDQAETAGSGGVTSLLLAARHLVYCEMGGPLGGCEITSGSDPAQPCSLNVAALRWEDHFADWVCEYHAQRAEARGSLVIRPRRHDGTPDV